MTKNFLKILIGPALVAIVFGLMPQVQAAAPTIFSYQGRLTDASGALLGGNGTNYYFKFSIWDSPTVGIGNKLWPFGSPGTVTISVAHGVFNVNIGDTANGYPDSLDYDFNSNANVYLQVQVSADNATFETLSPRQRISSSAYAINANTILGKTPGTGANNILVLDDEGDIDIAGNVMTAAAIQGGSALTSGNAFLINTASGFTGNLMDLQVDGSSKLVVNESGNTEIEGNLVVNTTGSSFAGTVTIGTVATNTITPSGAMVVGATGQNATLQGAVTTITSNGATNDIILDSADTIELKDDTNIAGNIDASGTIQAGSNNVTITLATGFIDADAISLWDLATDSASSTTFSASGLEVVSDKLTLLQGCADAYILKWSEANDRWECQPDDGGVAGGGDNLFVNGAAVADANFIDSVASGTNAAISWNLDDSSSPDEITLTIGAASATEAGIVTTNSQTFAGEKTFSNALAANGGITFDDATDTLGAFTLGGTLDAAANLLINIGNAGTDFDASGGLTLASTLTLSNNTLSCTACIDITDLGPNSVDDSELVDALTYTGILTLGNTGLHISDTDASHDLIIAPGSDLSADRTLTVVTGDADRTLTINGNATISGTNTGDQTSVTGNAGTATALQTARNINGVAFDGTADITVTAAAGTLTGNTLAAGVTASSLTSVGTLGALTVTGTTNINTSGTGVTTVGAASGTGLVLLDADWGVTNAGAATFSTIDTGQGANELYDMDQNVLTTSDVLFNTLTLTNTGLHILDTNASHDLIIAPGSDLSADRTLTVVTGDADRTLTINGNATISGTNTGDQTSVTGNAGTATALQTARNINGVAFDGTADITVTAAAGTLTGNTLAAGVTASSLQSVGTLTALDVDNININGNTISSTAGTDLLITPLAGQQLILDGTIEIDAGVITGATSISSTSFVGALTGNADTATALAANPADCAANTFAITIAANGDLTCATPTLGTDTSGNFVATIADSGSSVITVNNSGTENAAITLGITADSIGNTQLAFDTGQDLTTTSDVGFASIALQNGSGEISLDPDLGVRIYPSTAGLNRLFVANDISNGIGALQVSTETGNGGGLTSLYGYDLNTEDDGTTGTLDLYQYVSKDDANVRNYNVMNILAELSTGESNENTILNILNIDTSNSSDTGVTTNLIKASYGGAQALLLDSSGNLTVAGTLTLSGLDCSGNGNGGALTADASGVISCTDDDGGSGSFDATAVDSITWSDGANASNTWTFNVSGTDTTLLFGNNNWVIGAGSVDLGASGVRLSQDSDGAITFLGLGDGNDEDLTLNLDDTANTGVFSSSTGLNNLTFTGIGATFGSTVNIGSNTLQGTTAVIDFTDFDVSNDGMITLSPDGAGDAISITIGNGDTQALVFNATATDLTNTSGVIDLNVETSTDSVIGGVYLSLTTVADNGIDVGIVGNRTDLTISSDTGVTGIDLAKAEYINVVNNDTSSSVGFGQVIDTSGIGTTVALQANVTATDDTDPSDSYFGVDITLTNASNDDDSVIGMKITNNDHASDTPINAFVYLLNTETISGAVPDGIFFSTTGDGSITDAIDVSDDDITNALNIGANIILGTDGVIDFNNFDVDASGNIVAVSATLTNTGLHILDTNASHDLIIAPGSDLSADRTLTVVTGDADRTLTLNGNATLDDWFDQSVKQAASPTFAGLTLSGLDCSGNANGGALTADASGVVSCSDDNSGVGGSFDSTTIDSTTWSDGANASNTWTFDVSGTDTTLLFGNNNWVIGAGSVDLGAAGVRLSQDSDGALTFLGLGDGSDEDLTLNLDDTSNTGVFSSSTGLNNLTFTNIGATFGGNVNLASNTLQGTTAVIDFNNFDVDASGNIVAVSATLTNTGLHILDTNASHDLIIAPGSDLSADRTLTVVTGDADRTLTLNGNATLDDWFDQSVKQAASPTFAGLTLSGLDCSGNANGGALTADASGVVSCTDDDAGGGGGTLQTTYNSGNTIETASNNSLVITETTAAANTGDLLQLTYNAATGGTTSGDALQITLDAVDADGNTGNGIHFVVDQSQNTGSLILAEDDGGTDLFVLDESGAITTGVWNGTALTDAYVSDTLTASNFIGSGSSTNAVDLDTAEVAGILGVANGGTGTSTALTQGSLVFAGASGVYSQDNSNLFWDDTNNRLGIGVNSSLKSGLHLVGSTTTSGADAIAGIFTNTTLTNGTSSGFQFGNRFLNTVNGDTAGTEVGTLIRMTDSTTLANTVRGLEVQAWSGTNTQGTNTGIAAFGKTFGIQGTTDALAGAVSQPAAVFADLDNGSATGVGNAIRAYTDNATSATLVSIYQESSAYTGNALELNIGNAGSGSGSFASGNFLSLKKAGSQLAHIDSDGNIFATLNSSGTSAVCHVNNGAQTDDELTDCSGSVSADYAEMYPVEAGITFGDLVTIGTKDVITNDGRIIKQLVKSTKAYDANIIGIVSDNYGDFSSTGYNVDEQDNPMPVALNGRVPVKFSAENGSVAPGDYVTSSAIPGYAMKATRPGWVIGQVLSGPDSAGQIMVYIRAFYYDPTIVVDSSGNVSLQMGAASTSLVAQTNDNAAYVINQQGSGNLLQLQNHETDRFLIKNNGVTYLNAEVENQEAELLVITSNDEKVFTINARGQATFAGNIFIKDDTFAGSIATDDKGAAEIEFTYHLGSGKPSVQLTVEDENPAFAQISEWVKDEDGNYTGFKIKTFGASGTPVSSVVHYLVIGKPDGFETLNLDLLEMVSEDASETAVEVSVEPEAPASSSQEAETLEQSAEVEDEGTKEVIEEDPKTNPVQTDSDQPEVTQESQITGQE